MSFFICPAVPAEAPLIADMTVALIHEIALHAAETSFHVDRLETEKRCGEMLVWGQYFAWLAWEGSRPVGFIGLSESHALFAAGVMGTVQEFYVVPEVRSQGVGTALLDEVKVFAAQRGLHRLEVCTPPVPVFDGSEKFYERLRFQAADVRKMRLYLSPVVQTPSLTEAVLAPPHAP